MQAELFILRLSRNSGVYGLACMAFTSQLFSMYAHLHGEHSNSCGILLVRPLLDFSKQDLYKVRVLMSSTQGHYVFSIMLTRIWAKLQKCICDTLFLNYLKQYTNEKMSEYSFKIIRNSCLILKFSVSSVLHLIVIADMYPHLLCLILNEAHAVWL